MDKPAVTVSFAPDGSFLATGHVDEKGIFLWSNNMHFSNVMLKPVSAQPLATSMPSVAVEQAQEIKEDTEPETEPTDQPTQLSDKLQYPKVDYCFIFSAGDSSLLTHFLFLYAGAAI